MEKSKFLTYSEIVIKQEIQGDETSGKEVIELCHEVKQEPEVNFVCILPDIETDKGHSGDIEEVLKINKAEVNKKKTELNINKSEFNFRCLLLKGNNFLPSFQET